MKKIIKKYWFDACVFLMLGMLSGLLYNAIWNHDTNSVFTHSCYLVSWVLWYLIHRANRNVQRECDGLKVICAGLMAQLTDKAEPERNPDIKAPVWRKCTAGTKFDGDAIIVGLGDDRDPRLVRCAVNDSKYILVRDLAELPYAEDDNIKPV